MTDSKIAKGEFSLIDAPDFSADCYSYGGFMYSFIGSETNAPSAITLTFGKSYDEANRELDKNSEIVLDAFNVYNETGLTPRELLGLSRGLAKALSASHADIKRYAPFADSKEVAWEWIKKSDAIK